MGIIFDMNATDVIISGIRQHLIQNVVQDAHVNLPIGTRNV